MSKVHPDAKRIRNIIISFPIFFVTSIILYRRVFLGEEQRKLPQFDAQHANAHIPILPRLAGADELFRRGPLNERKTIEDPSERQPS